MTAFALAAASLMADPNLAEPLEWWPAEASAPIAIRGVVSAPTALDAVFGQPIARPSLIVWVAAQHAVAQGDRIRRGGQFHPVRDEPELDANGAKRRLTLGPAGAR